MSTRRKEGGPPGKEKRGTSASNAGRRSPAPTKTNDSGKSIPSYLKPTASSSSISDGKKKSSPTTDKATIERRRSFDKPPSPSRTTKSPASPNPTLRSSSFSAKTNNDSPGASVARRRSFDKPPSPSRTTKSPVSPSPTLRSSSTGRMGSALSKGVSSGGKQSTLHARPAVSSVLRKKSEGGSGALRKKRVERSPEKVASPDVGEPEPEPEPDDQECLVGEEEEPEYSLLGEEDVTNIMEQIEGESHDNDAVIESPTVEQEQRDESQEDMIESVEHSTDLEHKEEDEADEISNQREDIKEEANHTDNLDDHDESGADHPHEEKEKEEEEGGENEEAIEVENNSKCDQELEEKEEVEEGKKEEEEEDATPKVAHGKKDVALSNDVIEETRNKLIEQRKNKVKALAGAFETVISLQDK